MTIQAVKNSMYDLQTFLGDSGTITISNIPTDSPNYVLWIQINGKETVEKSAPTEGLSSIDIDLTVADIEALGVGQWPYGVKLSNDEQEDTYIPDLRIAPKALFIVKPQVVEGPANE